MMKKSTELSAVTIPFPRRILWQNPLLQKLIFHKNNSLENNRELQQRLLRQRQKAEIQELLSEIRVVQNQFEQELDEDLIEAHIWELHALEVRYQRILRQMKQSVSCSQDSSPTEP